MRKHIFSTAILTASTLAFTPYAHADEETELLRKQIKMLEARLDELERREKQRVTQAPAAAPVESRLAIIERKQELFADDAKAKAEKTPAIEIGNGKGLSITSPDKQYSLRIRAYAQADSRTFFANSDTANGVDNFLIRTARPAFEGKMTDYFSGRIVMDFGGGSTRLTDAHLDTKLWPEFNLRLGKFKPPVGLERWQSEQDILFVERAMPTNLVPSRDIGVMAFGELIQDQLEYQFAVTNGVADLGESSSDNDDNKDVNFRLFAHPFRWTSLTALSGLGVGVAGSYGDHQGTSSSSALHDGYRTPAQARFFTYTFGAYADGPTWRINPQAYYYNGAFGALAEYVLKSQEITRNTTHATLKNDAWMAAASYVLTGEDASFDGVKPERNFNLAKGDWGAFEVLGRYSALNVDEDTFSTFSSLSTSAKNAREATLGGTWYLNTSLKINLNYSWTRFNGGTTGGLDREDEQVLLSRAQFRF